MSKYEKVLIYCILVVILVAGVLFYKTWSDNQNIEQRNIQFKNKITEIRNKMDSVDIQAQAVSVYDANLGKYIYGRNENTPLPLASLVKTMNIVTTLQNLPEKTIVQIPPEALAQEGGTDLFSGEEWELGDLMKFTLISSSNVGAYAIAKNIPDIILKMNGTAKKIGMRSSVFFNVTGLSASEGRAGAYSSAKDANIMALYALRKYPEIFSATTLPEITLTSESNHIHRVENTNLVLNQIPNLLFSKTGFTSLSGGNLTVIFKDREDHKIVITVLGSTKDGRFSDMEKLVNILYN